MLTIVPLPVFPVGFDGVDGDDTVNNSDGWSHSQGVPSNDAWLHTDSSGVDVDGGPGWSNEEGPVDATGNGLYWFWDSTWSDARS
jgi:hypothetical protein